jgi:hypothetical protein
MPRKLDLIGQVFGRLTVSAEAGTDRRGNVMWWCRCHCGTYATVVGYHLRSGNTTSCGCARRQQAGNLTLVHGQADTPLYSRWKSMIHRVTDPNHKSYADYGGRGITVCEQWLEFETFAADMGPTFREDLTLDRIDVSGPYSPMNCRWASASEQARNKRNNRRLTFRGHTKTLAEWSEITGLHRRTIGTRLDALGWPVERALTNGADMERLARLT